MKPGDKGWVIENQRIHAVVIKEISPRKEDGGAILVEYEDKSVLIPTRWVFPEHLFTSKKEVEAKVQARIAKLQEALIKLYEEEKEEAGS